MEMGDAFTTVGAVVDDDAVAGGEAIFLRQSRGDEEEMAEDLLVAGVGLTDSRDYFFRNHEDVDWRLWIEVVNGDTEVVFMFNLRRNFPIDDSFKDCFLHHFTRLLF